ncbi:hypothetical protein XELAEV_18021613mg [Xenopus laevis]|uniref:Uncharacterized protein n=1 Tax=Xenopus laevis TaxID=8355 RepID=A0A974D9V2_XENLA|nr:hypothetical protein XELAEV_18021613mg [Xenopus laevis]
MEHEQIFILVWSYGIHLQGKVVHDFRILLCDKDNIEQNCTQTMSPKCGLRTGLEYSECLLGLLHNALLSQYMGKSSGRHLCQMDSSSANLFNYPSRWSILLLSLFLYNIQVF